MSTKELLEAYVGLVRRWADRLDLVAPGDLDRFWERHVEDSLRLAPLLDELPEGPGVDVGSGAGLPGVVLAIARPERLWRLLEPRKRRAAFLEEVSRELGLSCEVLAVTAEEAAGRSDLKEVHAIATARALTAPDEAFSLLLPLVKRGGTAALFVGANAELSERAEEWQSGIAIVRRETI